MPVFFFFLRPWTTALPCPKPSHIFFPLDSGLCTTAFRCLAWSRLSYFFSDSLLQCSRLALPFAFFPPFFLRASIAMSETGPSLYFYFSVGLRTAVFQTSDVRFVCVCAFFFFNGHCPNVSPKGSKTESFASTFFLFFGLFFRGGYVLTPSPLHIFTSSPWRCNA